MLNVVYWNGSMSKGQELSINLAVLVGTFISQFVVGLLADRYGRRRMYGVELCVLTVATIFVAITSEGALRSTNRLAWIVVWRFFMGLGIGMSRSRSGQKYTILTTVIGGDYPLSAVITAEYVIVLKNDI
jgi:PHS family inorganic phosphate transporter-like MFS transporter